jgi:hypothetical protein
LFYDAGLFLFMVIPFIYEAPNYNFFILNFLIF